MKSSVWCGRKLSVCTRFLHSGCKKSIRLCVLISIVIRKKVLKSHRTESIAVGGLNVIYLIRFLLFIRFEFTAIKCIVSQKRRFLTEKLSFLDNGYHRPFNLKTTTKKMTCVLLQCQNEFKSEIKAHFTQKRF